MTLFQVTCIKAVKRIGLITVEQLKQKRVNEFLDDNMTNIPMGDESSYCISETLYAIVC